MNGRVILMGAAGALALAAVASSARADALVDEAKAVVEKATARADKWDGPTSGPKAVAKKTVVYVAGDMRNGGILGVAHGLKEASDVLGWTYREIDGQGTVSGQASGLSQAMALKPDAIVVGGSDAVQQKAGLDEAAKQGIVIVGWHAGPKPGPMDGAPVFANVTTDAMEVAKVAAMKAIADFERKGGRRGLRRFGLRHRHRQGPRHGSRGSRSARAARCWPSRTRRSPIRRTACRSSRRRFSSSSGPNGPIRWRSTTSITIRWDPRCRSQD